MTMPLVSIQIPTYNQKQYIKEALDSALAQTYENLQIIVSDDCSPDYDIFEFLKEYQSNPKVLIHRNEKNLGRVGNYRNTLYNLVRGEWFVNLDGDDYFTNPKFVETAIKSILRSSSEVSFFQAGAVVKKLEYYKIPYSSSDNEIYEVLGLDLLKILPYGVGFTHASLLYNVKQAKQNDFYNFNTLDTDWFSYTKMFLHGSIILWQNKVYHWRKHDEQETHRINFKECKKKFQEFDELVKFYNRVPNKTKEYFFKSLYKDITIKAMAYLISEKKYNIGDFIWIIKKTKFRFEFIKPFFSLIKQNYLIK